MLAVAFSLSLPLSLKLSCITHDAHSLSLSRGQDPVKYVNYQEAVFLALQDLKAGGWPQAERVIIMVVGAGRGPLVRASLAAAERAQVPTLVRAAAAGIFGAALNIQVDPKSVRTAPE